MRLKKGPIPLYYQLERALRKRIHSRNISDTQPFPTERQLCEEYEVSRTTVRQALMILEGEGLIKREQGRGTFLAGQDPGDIPFQLYGYMDDLFLFGSKTRLELTAKKLIRLDARVARDMELEEGDEAYFFEGIRRLSGESRSALFHAWVPREIGEKIPLQELEPPFLIAMVEKVALERVKRAHQITSAAVATRRHESVINVRVGHPILVVKRIHFSTGDTVLQVAETHFPGDVYQPKAILERVISRNPDHIRFGTGG